MANIFEQAKQVMHMRKEAKRIQAEMEKITSTYGNGGIEATFRGDFTLTTLKISDEALEELKQGKTDRFITMLQNVINGSIKEVKKTTQEQMQKMMKSSDLSSMLGG